MRCKTDIQKTVTRPIPGPYRGTFFLALASSIVAFASIVLALATNVPISDDYHVLDSVLAMRAAPNWSERLRLLFALHNEHRIVLTRAVAYAMSFLPGGVDFRKMVIFGNLAAVASLPVIARFFPPAMRLPAISLTALIILLPQQFNLMFFPMAAVQAYWSLLFFFLYLLFSLRERTEYVAPIFFLAAVITTGGALFFFIPVALALALRRRWIPATFNVALALVIFWFYRSGSPRVEGSPLGYLTEHPLIVARLFLGLVGSVGQLPSYKFGWMSVYTTPVAGVLLLFAALYVCLRILAQGSRATLADVATFCCITCSLLMISLISVSRARYYAELDLLFQATVDGRYRIYSLFITAFCTTWLFRHLDVSLKLNRRMLLVVVACLFFFYILWSRYAIEESRLRAKNREATMQAWTKTGDASQLLTLRALTSDNAADILIRARAARIYGAPDQVVDSISSHNAAAMPSMVPALK